MRDIAIERFQLEHNELPEEVHEMDDIEVLTLAFTRLLRARIRPPRFKVILNSICSSLKANFSYCKGLANANEDDKNTPPLELATDETTSVSSGSPTRAPVLLWEDLPLPSDLVGKNPVSTVDDTLDIESLPEDAEDILDLGEGPGQDESEEEEDIDWLFHSDDDFDSPTQSGCLFE